MHIICTLELVRGLREDKRAIYACRLNDIYVLP